MMLEELERVGVEPKWGLLPMKFGEGPPNPLAEEEREEEEEEGVVEVVEVVVVVVVVEEEEAPGMGMGLEEV